MSGSEDAFAERECSGGFASTSLMKAALHNDVAAVERALECSAVNINAYDAQGRTALMIAAAQGNRDVALALSNAGGDVLLTNADGQTAEEIASQHGHGDTAAAIKADRLRRETIYAAIYESDAPSKGAPAADAMAKLLAQAGLPPGAKESPF